MGALLRLRLVFGQRCHRAARTRSRAGASRRAPPRRGVGHRHFTGLFRRNRVVGVDYSEPMMRKAQARVKGEQAKARRGVAVRPAHARLPRGASMRCSRNTSSDGTRPGRHARRVRTRARQGGESSGNHLGREAAAPRLERSFAPSALSSVAVGISWTRSRNGRPQRLRARDRAPLDAAARALLADPLRAAGDGEKAANGGCRRRLRRPRLTPRPAVSISRRSR